MVQKCWTMIKSHHCMVLWDTSMLLTLFIEINNKIMHNSINSFVLPHLSSNSLAQWDIGFTTDQWVTWMSSNLTGIFKFLPFPNYLNRVFWSVRKIFNVNNTTYTWSKADSILNIIRKVYRPQRNKFEWWLNYSWRQITICQWILCKNTKCLNNC